MKSIKEILELSEKYLKEKKVLSPRLSSELIVSYVLGCKRLDIYLNIEKPLLENEIDEIRALIRRRGRGEPLDYLMGYSDFYGCRIELSKDVLIPRPETEEMVSLIEDSLKNEVLDNKVLWDVCCGSGCIAIALKKKFPKLKVFASDISINAIEVASKNASKNGVDVIFKKGDLLEPLNEKADFVVCNPPYVSEEEYQNLSLEVKDFEPKIALVAKENGLEFYKRMAKDLPSRLRKHGKVFFEIGYLQAGFVKEIFSSEIWISKKVFKDCFQKDRFFFLEIE